MFGVAVVFTPNRIANAFKNPKPNTTQEEGMMKATSAAQGSVQATDKSSIRPFQFTFTDAELTDLRRRVNATKWPERELVQDASQGVQLSTMQKLASYWGKDYDWRKGEAKLKAVPHFTTEIDGLDIHFISCSFEREKCLADHHHTRLARIDYRAVEDYRTVDESDCAWWKSGGRFRRSDSVVTRLRFFR